MEVQAPQPVPQRQVQPQTWTLVFIGKTSLFNGLEVGPPTGWTCYQSMPESRFR